MKKLITLTLSFLFLLSCESEKKIERNIIIGDTITTASGLKYIYLKEGSGRKAETGSKIKVYTDLYLNDADTTIWRTANDKDSVFTFIHRKTSLIKGFTELYDYLYEGDEVIAILPDSLAYGEKGRGTVPPRATLVYKPLIVKYVSEPKESLIDTLLAITRKDKASTAISFYEKALKGELSTSYHTELEDVVDVLNEFRKDSSYVAMEVFSNYFSSKDMDDSMKQMVSFYSVSALQQQGKIEEAIKLVQPLTKQKLNQDYWKNLLTDLKKENTK